MKKIINPYVSLPGYNCFGCAPHNPFGVKMEFFEDGDDINAGSTRSMAAFKVFCWTKSVDGWSCANSKRAA